jgi:O-antigen biosynthesis protein
MQATDISIVIVNYNTKDFLNKCLISIQNATNDLKVETIVFDNNSSDGSVEYLKPRFLDVQFIPNDENIGFGKANNEAIKLTKGKYILILNPDTILQEDTLQTMYDFMEKNPETGIAGCKLLNPDGTFQPACRRGFPTPWASFSRLFGLQKMFPKSKLFSGYNMTYLSVDETYNVDAISGAFMFCRRDILEKTGCFDPDYFMYGEDIDLCYRTKQLGWDITYVHTTSIIHFKGESTRRSSINEVKLFYEAMQIFAEKNNKGSKLLMYFIKMGIVLRSMLEYLSKYRRSVLVIFVDLFAINLAMLIATKVRFGEFLGFPDYAYPLVFIVISLLMFLSMFSVGEYFEGKPSVPRSFYGLMVCFFVLSSLTYFFKEYAFSRGVILMTIGISVILSGIIRTLLSLYDKISGSESVRRIAIVGMNEHTNEIIEKLQTFENWNVDIVGIVFVRKQSKSIETNLPILGNVEYLPRIIEDNDLQEIIITETELQGRDIIEIFSSVSNPNVRFHVAQEFDDVLAASIINKIAGIRPGMQAYNLAKPRYRLMKRLADILISIFLLTIGLPFVYLSLRKNKDLVKEIWKIFLGQKSFIGLYPVDNRESTVAKSGMISLAGLSNPKTLTVDAIRNLNKYYLKHYNMILDISIFIKYIMGKNSGN